MSQNYWHVLAGCYKDTVAWCCGWKGLWRVQTWGGSGGADCVPWKVHGSGSGWGRCEQPCWTFGTHNRRVGGITERADKLGYTEDCYPCDRARGDGGYLYEWN